jgi:subtilisin family serine protease
MIALFACASPALAAVPAQQPLTRWIVQVAPTAKIANVIGAAHARWGAVPGQRFSTVLHGFATRLTHAQRDALAADPAVTAIVPDLAVHATGAPYPITATEVQPGVERVGATTNPDRPAASLDVDIAVLDTGIQPDNSELNIAGGYNCTDPNESEAQRADPANWADSATFGHGTHVSGIAAAIENGRGVAGVAQGARLWAIKVLDGGGNGYWSSVICGLDHVAQMRDPSNSAVPQVEVVNMSLAGAGSDDGDCGYTNADLLHEAICHLSDAGVTMVAAAGNSASDASGYIPAAYDEVITVSAMADWNGQPDGPGAPAHSAGTPPAGCSQNEADDAFASFSDYGSDVDLIAPGVCVLSTLPTDRLGMMSGTSMATPHVSGGAALYYLEEARLALPRPTPQQVRAALVAAGTTDWQVSTDPDVGQSGSVREPALNVSDLSLPPSFTIGAKRQVIRTTAGAAVQDRLWIAGLGGFDRPVNLAVDPSTVPTGTNVAFAENPASSPTHTPTLTLDVPADAVAGRYTVKVTGTADTQVASTAFTLIVYDTAADSRGPQVSLASNTQAGSITLPVVIGWPATAGAQRYRLQQSIDAGEWTTIAKPYGTKLSTTAWPGVRYQYRVQAKVAGVWRAWHIGPSAVVNPYEPSTAVEFNGTWISAATDKTYSELPAYSTTSGSSATFTFTGTSLAWISIRGPDRGKANISIDGTFVKTLDLYAGVTQFRALVFARTWSSAGVHTLRIDVLGRPFSRPRVDLDALVVVAN